MDHKKTRTVKKIAEEITHYLGKHPNAADSVEGITRWWLTQQGYEASIPAVQAALDMLVSTGYLHRSTAAHGKEVYSLAGNKDV